MTPIECFDQVVMKDWRVQGVCFATTNSQVRSKLQTQSHWKNAACLGSKKLLSGPLYCAGREGLAICAFFVLCVSGISRGRSCGDPGIVDAKEMNDSGIWKIHTVSSNNFKGLERGCFLCNAGIEFLGKGLGIRQNSSAG